MSEILLLNYVIHVQGVKIALLMSEILLVNYVIYV
jgi:hypothetical protein